MSYVLREVSTGGWFSDTEYPHYSNLPTVHPTAIDDYESTRTSHNIVHEVLGKSEPDITFRRPSLRTGTIEIWVANANDALNAETVLLWGQTLHLNAEDHPQSVGMFFVTVGDVTRKLTDTGQWVLTVGYQQVNSPVTIYSSGAK